MVAAGKDVVLILARELAANIATPMLVLDAVGTMVFYNESAEDVLGAPFSQIGETSAIDWDQRWPTTYPDGEPMSLLEGPLSGVINERKPAHGSIRVQGLDGKWHGIEATVYPLFASAERFVGAVAVFWEEERAK
jgi:PAS domain-containing protein